MHKKFKKLWVDALRSGKYKQSSTRYLVDRHDKWNPFGVLVDVGFEVTWVFNDDHGYWACEDATVLMPMWHAREAEFSWYDESTVMAMHLQKASFKEIARWIEKNL